MLRQFKLRTAKRSRNRGKVKTTISGIYTLLSFPVNILLSMPEWAIRHNTIPQLTCQI